MAKQHSTGDLYQRTTDRVIDALEQGVAPWIKPWRGGSTQGLPTNLSTGQEYRGINVVSLWCAAFARGFEHDLWVTQAQEKGWQVRKGAKSECIVKVGQVVKDADEGEKDERTFSYLKSYHVFNVAEVEGAPLPASEPTTDHERIAAAEGLIAATGARVVEQGDRACYARSTDCIYLPALGRFTDAGAYYAIALHELTHWTGHDGRLERKFGKRFGDDAYAAEELVAEMGSAFLCGHLGIEGHLQHPAYVDHWLKVLKNDKRAIFTAAAKASQAADYVRAFAGEVRQ
ncbi:MAG: DUF1738 domain-containing protein [Gammaproteobacteria bacterium]|nr:DUF1738 domain-containing protein [Gammaproteobacteria bacterium]